MAKKRSNKQRGSQVGKSSGLSGNHGHARLADRLQNARSENSGQLAGSGVMGAQIASQAVDGNLAGVPESLARILRPQAAHRWTLPALASMTPQYVENVLRGALSGQHVQLWELGDMMMDTWPEFAGCCSELVDGVMARKVVFQSWEEDGEKPTPSAEDRKALVSGALRRMSADAASDENDFEDTLRDIADGWVRGTICLEMDWHSVSAGRMGQVLAPRATTFAHPSNFAWTTEGWLGIRDERGGMARLPDHKFLVGIHKARAGSAMGNAIFRPLAWWWCAANFASDWLLNLAQLFGIPMRWANYDPNAPQATVDAICNMLQNMGSAGWAAFPTATTLELKDTGMGGDRSPQGDLLDRADRYARMLILGQTMSGSQDSSKGGGKAFGVVEADVKETRINAAAKYVAKVINTQMIPSICELNYGNRDECPTMDLIPDSEAGPEEAKRDETLSKMLPIPHSYLQAKYGLPMAAAGEPSTQIEIKGPKVASLKVEETDEDIVAKLAGLLDIRDDAIFAKELAKLTEYFS